MSRVTVYGHSPVLDDVVAALQRVGLVQIESHPLELPSVEVSSTDDRLLRLDEWVADAQFVSRFLGRYHTPTQKFSAFISEKFHLATDAFENLEPDTTFLRLYRECVSLSDRIASGERERTRLLALAEELEVWEGLHLQISRWKGTEHVVLTTGTVPAAQSEAIREMLREEASEVTVEELGPCGTRQAWVVMAHRCCEEHVRAVLALTDFTEVSFPGLEDYPAEEASRALQRVEELEQERELLEVRATELAEGDYADVVALAEAVEARRDALLVRERFAETERAFVITGWVRTASAGDLEVALAPWRDSVDIELAPPSAEDRPPIELDNPRWLRPFETLTDLYGRPQYNEVDPTPLLAPFFLLFFAICISDFGYGALLVLGAWLIKNRLDVAPGVKRFMDLVMYGGFGSMVVGVLLGSYLAIPLESLPPFLRSLQVLDPLSQLTAFLIGCVILGVVQVFFGVIVAAWDAWRRGDPGEAVFGQLSTIFLFAMVGVAAAVPGAPRWALPIGIVGTMLMQGHSIERALNGSGRPVWDRALGWTWLVAALASVAVMAAGSLVPGLIVLVAASVLGAVISKTARSAVVGLAGGAYAVYGMTSFIGDILSYTRLAALGLSSALVGYAFNLLAGMVWEPAMGLMGRGGGWILAGVIVAVLAAVVFSFGHVFNVVINLLGAFVHPARLQFVEFFSKFYEGGGHLFAPFRFRTKSMVLHAGAAGGEGGSAS